MTGQGDGCEREPDTDTHSHLYGPAFRNDTAENPFSGEVTVIFFLTIGFAFRHLFDTFSSLFERFG